MRFPARVYELNALTMKAECPNIFSLSMELSAAQHLNCYPSAQNQS